MAFTVINPCKVRGVVVRSGIITDIDDEAAMALVVSGSIAPITLPKPQPAVDLVAAPLRPMPRPERPIVQPKRTEPKPKAPSKAKATNSSKTKKPAKTKRGK